jgi:carboxymethylenebutenolidase
MHAKSTRSEEQPAESSSEGARNAWNSVETLALALAHDPSLMIESISIPVTDARSHEAALVLPDEGNPPFPGVVVIHDIYGFSADLKRHCQRFADAGYAAIAPDLYKGGRPGCVVKTLTSMATGKGFAYEVIDAARNVLAARDDVDANRIGIAGFCMGGGFALIAAADQSFAVAAPFYGAVPNEASRLEGLCPTIAQFGKKDTVFLPQAKRLAPLARHTPNPRLLRPRHRSQSLDRPPNLLRPPPPQNVSRDKGRRKAGQGGLSPFIR